jgi:hypothetical protein
LQACHFHPRNDKRRRSLSILIDDRVIANNEFLKFPDRAAQLYHY